MTTTQTFIIRGMDCANEVRLIRAAVDPLPGVASLEVDLVRGHAHVAYDSRHTSPAEIQQAIHRAGFSTEVEGSDQIAHSFGNHGRLLVAMVAGVCFVGGFAMESAAGVLPFRPVPPWLPQALHLAAALLSARFFLPRALSALRQLHADMNVLVTVASAGAFLLGDWGEGAAVAFLFAMANLLESWSAARVRKSIERFLDLTPLVAERVEAGSGAIATIPNAAIQTGDLLLVRPGARIPADALVEEGCSYVQQAALTGEATPFFAEPGVHVLAGSTNGEGTLHVRATCDAAHSRAARIKKTIGRAQTLRSATERWVDRFSRLYTPLVLVIAALLAIVPPLAGFDAREWFYNALVVVLIACPCALVISTPVTMVCTIGALARGGVLLRGGDSIERAAAVKAVAFDKTGVLTQGRFRVNGVHPVGKADVTTSLTAAAALERLSEHPVARAVVSYAEDFEVPSVAAAAYRAIPGQGGCGLVEGNPVWVGNPRLAMAQGAWREEAGETLDRALADAGTVVCVGSGSQLWMLLTLADSPRSSARASIAALRELGIAQVVMLTGDRPESAAAVARAVGLTAFHAALLPEDKLGTLRDLEAAHGPVAMVGDGLNDAPAMAAAAFSIASGDRASNAAVEAADAMIWDGDLRRIPWLLAHARRAMAIVRQNVAIAIASKLLFVILAACGLATLWMAVLADVGATLVVTFNGLRMLAADQAPTIETREELAPTSTSS